MWSFVRRSTFDGPDLCRSHMTSSPFRELVNILLENAPIPQPTSVKAESTFNPLPSHKFLDASRRYPVREVVDFWKGPIPDHDPEVSAPDEDRVDCNCWSWEGEDARIIRRDSLPATTKALPLPASSGALEIAASPGVPTLASRTERGGPERCVRWSVYIQGDLNLCQKGASSSSYE